MLTMYKHGKADISRLPAGYIKNKLLRDALDEIPNCVLREQLGQEKNPLEKLGMFLLKAFIEDGIIYDSEEP